MWRGWEFNSQPSACGATDCATAAARSCIHDTNKWYQTRDTDIFCHTYSQTTISRMIFVTLTLKSSVTPGSLLRYSLGIHVYPMFLTNESSCSKITLFVKVQVHYSILNFCYHEKNKFRLPLYESACLQRHWAHFDWNTSCTHVFILSSCLSLYKEIYHDTRKCTKVNSAINSIHPPLTSVIWGKK